jgi:hypothetical protein
MDHGNPDKIYLDGRQSTVSPTDLNRWLEQLEQAVPGLKVNIILEACHSGSFVDELSKPGRVILASTAPLAVAYASEQGAIFSDVFLNTLAQGASLYESFEEGRATSFQAHNDQDPQFYDGEKGQEAARRGFNYMGTLADEPNWPPYPVWANVTTLTSTARAVNEILIEAKVEDDNPAALLDVWAVVYEPGYRLPDPSQVETLYDEALTRFKLEDRDGDHVYSVKYSPSKSGVHRVVVYARDELGALGRPRSMEFGASSQAVYLPVILR